MRITARDLILGAGAHGFDRDRLAAYRASIAVPERVEALGQIVGDLDDAGYQTDGRHYARLPRGYTASLPLQERFFLHNALWTRLEKPHPEELASAGLVDHCVRHWQAMTPLHRWIVDHLS